MPPLSPPWLTEAEELKTRILDRLERMPPETRHYASKPGEWSAAQMVAHLVLVEEMLGTDWRDAALRAPKIKPNWRSALIVRLASAGMRGPLRIPTRPFLEPGEPGDLLGLSTRWEVARERLPQTFPADPTSLWIIHPIFGPLSRDRMGAFLVAHLHYHLNRWPTEALGP